MSKEIIKYTTLDKFKNLEKEDIQILSKTFAPIFEKLSELKPEYEAIVEILDKDIDKEVQDKARELRLNIMKVRTSTKKLKADLKAGFLERTRAIDSSYNDVEALATSWEEQLSYKEKYFELLEEKRKQDLHEERLAIIQEFLLPEESSPSNLGELDEDIFEALLTNKKNKLILFKEEQRQIEEQKQRELLKVQIDKERRNILLPVSSYLETAIPEDLSILSEEEFNSLVKTALTNKEFELEKRKLQQLELDKEKEKAVQAAKEAQIEKDKLLADQRVKEEKAKAEAIIRENLLKERGKLVQPYIQFIGDYHELINLPEQEFREALEDVRKSAKLFQEAEAEKLKNEVKKDTSNGIITVDFEDVISENPTWVNLITDLKNVKSRYSFENTDDIKLKEKVDILINKIIKFIQDENK